MLFSFSLMYVIYKTLLKGSAPIIVYLLTTALSVSLSLFIVSVRPLLFSTAFLLILVSTLLYHKKKIKYLPILFFVWANMHADFTLGLFIFGVYKLMSILEQRKRHINLNSLIKTTWPLLLSFMVTAINPFGINLWRTLLNEINTNPLQSIAEFKPLSYNLSLLTILAIHIITGLILAGAYMQRKKFYMWYLLLILFFFVLSSRSIYFERVLIVIGAFVLKDFLVYLHQTASNIQAKHVNKAWQALAPVLVALLTITSIEHLIITGTYNWEEDKMYPNKAVDYVKRNPPEGKMLNRYDWGGYLIWQLPEYKTFIDGRMASWRYDSGKYILIDYFNILTNPKENQELLDSYIDNYNIGWALISKDFELYTFLTEQRSWQETYQDNNSVILLKN